MNEPIITTYSGRHVNPLNVKVEDVDPEDLAHHLACQNRFVGATEEPISIAQHSWYVSMLCTGTGFELEALLHDGSEAYLGDVTKWLKAHPTMAGYREAEDRAQAVIYRAFGCAPECCETGFMPEPVKEADNLMVRFEARAGFGSKWRIVHPRYPDCTPEELLRIGPWHPWDWRTARYKWLHRLRELWVP